ncbi:MAG: hypothetical protein IPL74_12655 [Bacteroidetes bacterium]|nr:hypothetical protein [Bacteroidota bacterium]
MTKIENIDFDFEMQIVAIELLSSSLNLPGNPNTPAVNFSFNISIESRADAVNKYVFVIVHVDIKNDVHTVVGSLSVSCILKF